MYGRHQPHEGARERARAHTERIARQAIRTWRRAAWEAQGADLGLGFVDTIVNVASQVLSFGVSAITQAVHKSRQKRRAYKRRMEPLTDQDLGEMLAVVVPQHANFLDALPALTDQLAELREGRRNWLVEPNEAEVRLHGGTIGSRVNELKSLQDAFKRVRKEFKRAQREQQRVQHAQAAQSRGKLEVGVAAGAVVLALGLLGAAYYATR